MTTNSYVDGKVHVRRARCATCIFRPEDKGRIVGISDQRVAGMVEDSHDAAIACHKHLYQGEKIEPVCRGFFDLGVSFPLRLADSMGVIEWYDDAGCAVQSSAQTDTDLDNR